jgi:5-(carboxyamino)imidazole ribonucleotide synthase
MPVANGSRVPRVGIVGAGQLARMTVQTAIPLAVQVRLLAASADDSAAQVCRHVAVAQPTDFPALAAFAAGCDVLTFDHELVEARHLRDLERAGRVLRPSAETMAIAQNKARQFALWRKAGLPSPEKRAVSSAEEIVAFGDEHGWPVIVKAAQGGYDGRGVWVVPDARAAAELWLQALDRGLSLLVEQRVAIEHEIAVVLARRPGGETVVYPVVKTVQRDGICHELHVPAPIDPTLAAEAERIARAVAEAMKVVGILAVEMFVSEGRVLINEIATRPHNSGHFSLGGALTSQFENHLRAVLDWPLGRIDLLAPAVVTRNVLALSAGTNLHAGITAALAIPGVMVHLYGKQPRPGRKVGHVTALGDDLDDARERATRAVEALGGIIWERGAEREEAHP